MELFFLVVLIILMASALGSGFPVAFALPGSAILAIALAGASGYVFAGDPGAYFHSGTPWQWMSAGVTNLRSVYWVAQRDTLIAVPLFIFMGIMLQRSKIAEDLLVTMAQLFGPVPGGLGISVVFVGALLAATTGIVGATVVAMGLISLPAMMQNKYSTPLATGTIAASGTLGQIIPPSIVLIILADQLASATDQAGVLRKTLYKNATGEFSMPSVFDVGSTSAGEMFLGALVPGLVLVGLYMLYILIFATLRPSAAPAVKYDGKFDSTFWKKVGLTLVPPLTLIFLVLGSIITGVATVNQAGAIGAVGATVMAGYRLAEDKRGRYFPAILGILSAVVLAYAVSNFEMNIKLVRNAHDQLGIWIGIAGSLGLLTSLIWSGFRVYRINHTMDGVMIETAKTTSLVFVILMGAAILTAAFRAFGGEELVRAFLNGLPGGFWSKFIVVMGVIFILGFFLDFIEISVVVVPIVAPILLADPSANITAVWLGVMIGLNIQTSFLTPPFGFALFYLRGVAPAAVKTIQIYKGVVPFILLQLVALTIVGLTPSLVNYLPNRVSFLSETSPPPRNPRLQECLGNFIRDKLAQDNGQTLAAIKTAEKLDLSYLPRKFSRQISGAFSDAEKSINALGKIYVASDAVTAAAVDYRPQLIKVRQLQKQIRVATAKAKELKTSLGQAFNGASSSTKAIDKVKIVALDKKIAALKAKIPPNWPKVYKSFRSLVQTENKDRRTFQSAADNSYDGVVKAIAVIDSTKQFGALEAELTDLRNVIETEQPKVAVDKIKSLTRKFRKVAGANKIASLLSKVRRVLKKKKVKMDKALKLYDKAKAEYDAQKIWRARAQTDLRAGLVTYLAAIKPTLGIRSQPKLSREQALYLAWCSSGHEDISLNF